MSISKERAIASLWKRGELSYKLRAEQKKLLALLDSAPTDLAVFNISRRFGKSTTCVVFAIEQALRRKQRVLYSTAFRTDLENFIQPIFEWAYQDCPDNLRPSYNAARKEYQFFNGSVIRLIGLDKNSNSLRGNAVDILIVDEAGFVTKLEYLFKSVIIPATMKRPFKLIFPSTPAESPLHFWSAELIPKAKERGTYVHLTIDDISDLRPEERKRLLDEVGGEYSTTAQREFFGAIVVDTVRSIAPSFSPDKHVQPVEPDHVKWMLFGDSGGVQDKTVFLRVGYDHNTSKVIFRDEQVFEPGTTTAEIVTTVKTRWPGLTLVLDASGQLLIDYSAQGLPASLPQKDEFNAGLLLLNTTFHNDRVVIHPDCKLLIRTLSGGLLNRNRTDYERSEALGHADACAAAIYALRGCDKTSDIRPQVSRMTHFIHGSNNPAQKQADTIRKMFR